MRFSTALALSGSILAVHHASSDAAPPAVIKHRRVEDDYEFHEALGEGAFAVVRAASCKRTGKKVAVKCIATTQQTAERGRAEVEVLQRVSLHRCIAKFEDVYEDVDAGKFYIVMEFVDGGCLLDRVISDGTWTEANAARLLKELGGAVALLHAQGLCHADIKPENVLLTADGDVRLVDFGLSCEIQRGASKSRGSYWYWPPELYTEGQAGLGMDMWSLGCILYIVLAGKHPWDPRGKGDGEAIRLAIVGESGPSFERWPASAEAREVCRALLRKNPSERLTIEQLLHHPWMRRRHEVEQPTGWNEVANRATGLWRSMFSVPPPQTSQFEHLTAKLRAACFAVVIQQQAAEVCLTLRTLSLPRARTL